MPTCSDIITAPGSVDGWLKVGHVVDGQFQQLFGYEDPQGLGVRGAIASAQNQGFCTVSPPAGEAAATTVAEANAIPIEADPQGGIDPLWGLMVLGGIGVAFVGGAIAVYRSAVAKAQARKHYQSTRLTYPSAGVYEPNPFANRPAQNPFARALDEFVLMDAAPPNPESTNPSNNYQHSGEMVEVFPRSSHRTTTHAATPESNEVVGVVVDSSHRTTTAPTTAPPMPGTASTDPFDYAPFSFFANNVSPYERACVWVTLGENMSQRDALEKIYGIPDAQKNSANWVKARDRYQDIKFDIELQIQKQQQVGDE